jgi:hypothetical protein
VDGNRKEKKEREDGGQKTYIIYAGSLKEAGRQLTEKNNEPEAARQTGHTAGGEKTNKKKRRRCRMNRQINSHAAES